MTCTFLHLADVVHLGHMYADSDKVDRESRVTHAATTMGVTVVAGAATTMGAGAVMLLCQMTFFTKVRLAPVAPKATANVAVAVNHSPLRCVALRSQMAWLIVLTILFSFLTALGPFMAMCALAGPQGEVGSISKMAQACWKRFK